MDFSFSLLVLGSPLLFCIYHLLVYIPPCTLITVMFSILFLMNLRVQHFWKAAVQPRLGPSVFLSSSIPLLRIPFPIIIIIIVVVCFCRSCHVMSHSVSCTGFSCLGWLSAAFVLVHPAA
ncbi:hypothetical protein B0H65DRAFT_90447 [Neurospora tetraspora]|uniref:Uncharacterized protein n=1 Tax=Neurospora tetraspora TaxID=94610 RepID=A0AAE0MUA1_9PEZI|nr:hypothetical protein B0H65DRAFT_90447 [Neurospora tetraspora]